MDEETTTMQTTVDEGTTTEQTTEPTTTEATTEPTVATTAAPDDGTGDAEQELADIEAANDTTLNDVSQANGELLADARATAMANHAAAQAAEAGEQSNTEEQL